MPDPTTVLLVRHGMNDFVKAHRLAGWMPGVHLNDLGLRQAQAVAERLAAVRIAAVYSSPLERTMETAQPIADRHSLPVISQRELGELDPGEWTGRLAEEVKECELWRQMQRWPSMAAFPGGEAIAEAQRRIARALDQVRFAHPGETVVVVSHSDPIRLAVAFFTGLPLDLYQRLMIGPASITELVFTNDGPRLVRANDRAHVPDALDEPHASQHAGAPADPPRPTANGAGDSHGPRRQN